MDEPPATWPARLPPTGAQQEHDERIHALRTPLTEVILRVNLVRRHLRRGDDPRRADEELESVEQALAQLVAVIARIDDEQRRNH
jgi:hypothetical protein